MRAWQDYRVSRFPVAFAALAVSAALLAAALGGIARMTAASAREKRPIYCVDTQKPHAALGINCAWGDGDIPAILAVLEEHGVKATFFVAGSFCDMFPESVRMLAEAGHEIASHSDSHRDLTKLSEAEALKEIRESGRKLQEVSGKRVALFRVPSGAYNTRIIELIEGEGLYPIQWSVDSLDYRAQSPEDIRRRLAKLDAGAITLFHGGTKHTAAALPLVLADAKAAGISFVTVSELIHPRPYTVDFEGKQRPINNGQLTTNN
jgi:peptidoglycan/xylan/chitin deacetylase (PgdA/CDA1 family)